MTEKGIVTTKLDKQISLFVTIQVVLLGTKNVLVQCVPILYDNNERLNIINLSLVSILYVFVLIKSQLRKSIPAALAFNAFIVISIVFTLFFFPQNFKSIQAIALRWIIVCFFTGYLVSKLRNFDLLEKYMLTGSYVMTFSCLIYSYEISHIGHSSTSDWSTYSMSMSYVALWAVIWQLHAFFKRKNNLALIAAIVGIVVIFMYGSRNPLLAIFCYVVIELYNDLKDSKSTLKRGVALFFIIIAAFFIIQGKQLVVFGAKSLIAIGINNRTLTLLVNSDVDDFSTGRDDIHKEAITLIWDKPIMGNGICGAETNINEMAHSLYLDILVTYGIFIGTLFLIAIIVLCLKALKRSEGISHQILVMYICLVFPRGFTGGDMWQSDVFWWLMGIVFMILTNSKIRNIQKWQVLQSD